MKKRAVVVAVNDYPGTGMDLAGCVNDGRDLGALLMARGYAVTMLLDAKATGEAIRTEIRRMMNDSMPGDKALFAISSHGTQVPDQNQDESDGLDEAICPYDVMTNGPIIDDELAELFGARRTGVHFVCFFDSCHSGTVSKFAPDLSTAVEKVRYMPASVFMDIEDAPRGIRPGRAPGRKYASLLMAGCQDYEYCYDASFAGRPNGAFTRMAIDAFKTLPAGATYNTWQKMIRTRLPSSRYPQTPVLYGTTTRRNWEAL